MKLEVNEDNIELFKMTLWLNLVIGIYGIYLYSVGHSLFNLIIGSINIGVWVFLRKVEV
jgi:hypothetical protein